MSLSLTPGNSNPIAEHILAIFNEKWHVGLDLELFVFELIDIDLKDQITSQDISLIQHLSEEEKICCDEELEEKRKKMIFDCTCIPGYIEYLYSLRVH